MTVESEADRLIMLSDFGVSATFTPSGGSARTVTGIFENAYAVINGVESSAPIFTARSSDVAPANGATVVIGEITYRVLDAQNDGSGMTQLVLTRD